MAKEKESLGEGYPQGEPQPCIDRVRQLLMDIWVVVNQSMCLSISLVS